MSPYQGAGVIMGCKEKYQIKVAKDYINTGNANIEMFLANKSHKMKFRLERDKADFIRFCLQIQARGEVQKALGEFDVTHNAS